MVDLSKLCMRRLLAMDFTPGLTRELFLESLQAKFISIGKGVMFETQEDELVQLAIEEFALLQSLLDWRTFLRQTLKGNPHLYLSEWLAVCSYRFQNWGCRKLFSGWLEVDATEEYWIMANSRLEIMSKCTCGRCWPWRERVRSHRFEPY